MTTADEGIPDRSAPSIPSSRLASPIMLAAANMCASFAGGSMIGMSSDHAGGLAVQAFLVGTVIGLILLLTWHRARSVGLLPLLAIFAALTSGVATLLVGRPSAVFALLCLYFAAWFLGRTTRMGAAAGRNMVVGAVDGTY